MKHFTNLYVNSAVTQMEEVFTKTLLKITQLISFIYLIPLV